MKQLVAAQRRAPFAAPDLVAIRIEFYRDEPAACARLDIFYLAAAVHLGTTPVHPVR